LWHGVRPATANPGLAYGLNVTIHALNKTCRFDVAQKEKTLPLKATALSAPAYIGIMLLNPTFPQMNCTPVRALQNLPSL